MGQSLAWRELHNSPYTGRHNDVYFVSSEHGWIVNGDGEIYTTRDGGAPTPRALHPPRERSRVNTH